MADDDENGEKAAILMEFCAKTGLFFDDGKFFLRNANWDIDRALTNYRKTIQEDTYAPPRPKKTSTHSSSHSENRIATLSTLAHSSDEENDDRNAFFAGGSLHSGQQILGPGTGRSHPDCEDCSWFASFHNSPVPDASSSSGPFQGRGYVLGESVEEESVVVNEKEDTPKRKEITLKIFRTGFTLDDGELREFSDPENQRFVDSVRRGIVPAELLSLEEDEVGISLEDHRQQDYVPTTSRMVFSGEGHRLATQARVPDAAIAEGDASKNEEAAQEQLNLDPSEPVISVQVRLADGSRITLKLNHGHTVGDIRHYIVVARPQYAATEFSLMTSFPPVELTDLKLTVIEANLANSVIVQKLCNLEMD